MKEISTKNDIFNENDIVYEEIFDNFISVN